MASKKLWCAAISLAAAIPAAACGSTALSGSPGAPGLDGGAPDATADAESDVSTPDGAAVPPGDDASTDADAGAGVSTPAPDYLWYLLDETQGTTVKDSTSHHFDMQGLTGVVWNDGANFDGTSTCAVTNVDSAYRAPPLTISAWLTPSARADGTLLLDALLPFPANALSGDVPGVGGYGIGLNVWTDGRGGSVLGVEGVSPCTQAGLCAANASQNADAGDAGFSCTSGSVCSQGFVAGATYFVVVTIDAPADGGIAPRARVYVNGQLFDEDAAFIPPPEATQPLYLGCCNLDTGYASERFYKGRMRDVRVYKRSLAPGEVGQLFVNGPATGAPAGSADAGPPDGSAGSPQPE